MQLIRNGASKASGTSESPQEAGPADFGEEFDTDGLNREQSVVVRDLWKAFYDPKKKTAVTALKGVSLTISPGQFVSIVGPSGCGKTTLLRILAGLESRTSGEFTLNPPDLPAVVFQDSSLFPWMNTEDNVSYRLRLQGWGAKARRAHVQPLLELMGLSDFKKAPTAALSGGMKQRVSVARALADHKEGILLMDEPFGALDEQTRLTLQQELLRIWQKTASTVVFITHSVDEAIVLSDRVIVMSQRPGRIVADIEVPFERPRDVLELRSRPEFAELNSRIWRLLREEV